MKSGRETSARPHGKEGDEVTLKVVKMWKLKYITWILIQFLDHHTSLAATSNCGGYP